METDKVYWHKYIEFYENLIPEKLNKILEIGVLNGDSIKYWRSKYPYAQIYGLDILKENEIWPKDDKIEYYEVNQGNGKAYREVLFEIGNGIDLIIEDGSHLPLHQKTSLIESIDFLGIGGVYILEDIHTSHFEHDYYKKTLQNFNKQLPFLEKKKNTILMPLQAMLMIEFYKRRNLNFSDILRQVDFNASLFTYEELSLIFNKVKSIKIYKRNVLPDYCYRCKSNDFDFINLKCTCGVDLYQAADSMSVFLKF